MASSVCAVEGTPERILRVPLSSESLGLVLQGPTVNNYFFDKKSSSLARNTKAKLSVFALLGVFELIQLSAITVDNEVLTSF